MGAPRESLVKGPFGMGPFLRIPRLGLETRSRAFWALRMFMGSSGTGP